MYMKERTALEVHDHEIVVFAVKLSNSTCMLEIIKIGGCDQHQLDCMYAYTAED